MSPAKMLFEIANRLPVIFGNFNGWGSVLIMPNTKKPAIAGRFSILNQVNVWLESRHDQADDARLDASVLVDLHMIGIGE